MERHIGPELRILQNMLIRHIQNAVNSVPPQGISGPNVYLLKVLKEHEGEKIFQRDLEKVLSITKSTCSKVLSTLEDRGLVKRLPVKDARFNKICLTPLGSEFVEKTDAIIEAFERRLTAGFSPEERAQLFSFFDRLKANIAE